MHSISFSIISSDFKIKALEFASQHFSHVCYLEGNNQPYLYDTFPSCLAFGIKRLLEIQNGPGSFEQLKKFKAESESTIFGFLSYDLKNELEETKSENSDHLGFPVLCFFEPEYILDFQNNTVKIEGENPSEIFNEINNISSILPIDSSFIKINSKITKANYLDKVREIQSHILRGNIYELNFCQEFYADNVNINPAIIFNKLNKISPMPFASFFKARNKYLICASPERFLKKKDRKLISQPIKGTVKRGKNQEEDIELINSLLHSEKELAENVMIVDLVRNDLSKTAKDGSIKVEELFGVYSFSNVHQMISTIVSELGNPFDIIDAIKNAFPMGSMTGAPKLRAMELIENFEETKRGLFSGSVGYITPKDDFDFNVVIRSILYNETAKYLSFQVGSAITIDADAEKEWEECEVKISAIKRALGIE